MHIVATDLFFLFDQTRPEFCIFKSEQRVAMVVGDAFRVLVRIGGDWWLPLSNGWDDQNADEREQGDQVQMHDDEKRKVRPSFFLLGFFYTFF